MGLIQAIKGAGSSVFADQWREYFYCDALRSEVLVKRGQKQTNGKRSSNSKSDDNIISNGSIIAVADGQCMMIVDQGKIAEFCAEPGEFVYDSSTEPSVFYGGFGKGLLESFKTFGKRFTFGGDTAKDQRIYFINTKEILGNKYGTPNPVPFRVVDKNIGMDIDISIRCHGEFSYRITDPMVFYTKVCGNVEYEYTRDNIDSMVRSELMTALQPALAKISALGIRYSELPGHTVEIADALNEVLSAKWSEARGISVASFGVNGVTASEEDEARIKKYQETAILRDPGMAAATLVSAQAQAMQDAAKNDGGAFVGFAGMNMVQGAGGSNMTNLYQMASQQQAAQPAVGSWTCVCGTSCSGKFCPQCGKTKPEPNAADSWKCGCGTENTGKFCMNCGKAKPADDSWVCSCGTQNKSNFCMNCGAKKPASAKSYKCNKCGWEPADKSTHPKFCPECGDIFDAGDEN